MVEETFVAFHVEELWTTEELFLVDELFLFVVDVVRGNVAVILNEVSTDDTTEAFEDVLRAIEDTLVGCFAEDS